LKWVLTELKAVTDGEAVSMSRLAIAEKSIQFSKDKIKNYLKFLNSAYKKARAELANRIET
jgi:hypothetical protein